MSDNPESKRRYGESVFAQLSDSPTLESLDADIYGDGTKSKTSKHLRAKPHDISKIYPDALQPRRTVPSELRALWGGDPATTGDLFDEWLERINAERDTELIWRDILAGDQSSRGKDAADFAATSGSETPLETLEETLTEDTVRRQSPLEASFLRLVELAASIKRDGLTNPITVGPRDNKNETFVIETGERRWLAYHLLRRFDNADEWREIPARRVRETSVWRQASENNARDDLNAVAKARQLALLLMDALMRDKDSTFDAPENFDHEREFYAQVGDGNKHRIPRNYGEHILNAMGLSSASHLRRYRAILRVDNALWDAADDGDWTEREIRDKLRLEHRNELKRDPGHGSQPAPSGDPRQAERNLYARKVKEIGLLAQKAAAGQVMSTKKREEVAKTIKELREWLKQQEKLISNND